MDSATSASTGKSAFELMYGAPVRQPLDLVEGVVGKVSVTDTLVAHVRRLVGEARG